MKFKNLSIKTKILSGTMVLVLIMVVLGLLTYNIIGKVSGALFGITQHNAKAVEYATAVERMSLAAILEQKNYLLDKNEETHKRALDALQELNTYLDKLDALAGKYKNNKLIREAEAARKGAAEYAEQYNKAVELLKAAGSAEKIMNDAGVLVLELFSAYINKMSIEMEDAIANNKELIATYNTVSSMANSAMELAHSIRTYEKEYIIHPDEKVWQNLEARLKDLVRLYNEIGALQKDESTLEMISKARDATVKYRDAAESWVRLDKELKEKVLPAMKTQGENVIKQVRAAENEGYLQFGNADRAATTLVSQAAAVINVTILFAIALCVVVAFTLALIITRPIAKCLEFTKQLERGDVSTTLAIDQKDEIGMLAGAMNSMSDNLRSTVRLAERIADGDLTVAVKPLSDKDSLGTALKQMVEKLSGIMSEINVASSNVAAGSEQLSSTSQSMSQGATEQASSLEEISSSMNEIASQTRQNAENASQANKLADEARDFARKGNSQMQAMVTAMKEINESSQNISKIIKVIDEIAFQTNLLALNAAVEAARAGKHGKGFAVVAEEVRNLAARSAKAAKETEEMIEGSVKKIADGSGTANLTAGALKEIVVSVGKVTDLVAEIAAASNEQALGVSQITQGLGQIDQVTQQNTAHAEESASAAEELSSQAMMLQKLISTFKLSENMPARGSSSRPVTEIFTPPEKSILPGADAHAGAER